MTMRVFRYSYWDEGRGIACVAEGFATLEAIRDGLGIPIFSASKLVPKLEVLGGVWYPPPIRAKT